jgi:hypothetical protein
MTTRKKLVKQALQHPEQFASAELLYMKLWLKEKKHQKALKKKTTLQ